MTIFQLTDPSVDTHRWLRLHHNKTWEYSHDGVIWKRSNFTWDTEIPRYYREWSEETDVHSHTALAMALELTAILTRSGERGDDLPDDYDGEPHCELDGGPGCDQCVADWLRDEVIKALYDMKTR